MSETLSKTPSNQGQSPSRRIQSKPRKTEMYKFSETEELQSLIPPNTHQHIYEQLEKQLEHVVVPQIEPGEDASDQYTEIQKKLMKAIEEEMLRENIQMQQTFQELQMIDLQNKRLKARPQTQQEMHQNFSIVENEAKLKKKTNFTGIRSQDSKDTTELALKFDLNKVGILKISKQKLVRQFDQARYESKLLKERRDRILQEIQIAKQGTAYIQTPSAQRNVDLAKTLVKNQKTSDQVTSIASTFIRKNATARSISETTNRGQLAAGVVPTVVIYENQKQEQVDESKEQLDRYLQQRIYRPTSQLQEDYWKVSMDYHKKFEEVGVQIRPRHASVHVLEMPINQLNEVRELKNLILKAQADNQSLNYYKKNAQKDLIACRLERNDVQINLDKVLFIDKDSDKIRHLEHCRQLLVNSTLSIWKKKVETNYESLQKELQAKQHELHEGQRETEKLLSDYSKKQLVVKQERKNIDSLRSEQRSDAKADLGRQIIEKKNKEFVLIESMSLIKLVDVYFGSSDTYEQAECIKQLQMLLNDRQTYIKMFPSKHSSGLLEAQQRFMDNESSNETKTSESIEKQFDKICKQNSIFQHNWEFASQWQFYDRKNQVHGDTSDSQELQNRRKSFVVKVGLMQFARNSLQSQLLDQSYYSTDLKMVIKQNRNLFLLLKNDCCDMGSLSILQSDNPLANASLSELKNIKMGIRSKNLWLTQGWSTSILAIQTLRGSLFNILERSANIIQVLRTFDEFQPINSGSATILEIERIVKHYKFQGDLSQLENKPDSSESEHSEDSQELEIQRSNWEHKNIDHMRGSQSDMSSGVVSENSFNGSRQNLSLNIKHAQVSGKRVTQVAEKDRRNRKRDSQNIGLQVQSMKLIKGTRKQINQVKQMLEDLKIVILETEAQHRWMTSSQESRSVTRITKHSKKRISLKLEQTFENQTDKKQAISLRKSPTAAAEQALQKNGTPNRKNNYLERAGKSIEIDQDLQDDREEIAFLRDSCKKVREAKIRADIARAEILNLVQLPKNQQGLQNAESVKVISNTRKSVSTNMSSSLANMQVVRARDTERFLRQELNFMGEYLKISNQKLENIDQSEFTQKLRADLRRSTVEVEDNIYSRYKVKLQAKQLKDLNRNLSQTNPRSSTQTDFKLLAASFNGGRKSAAGFPVRSLKSGNLQRSTNYTQSVTQQKFFVNPNQSQWQIDNSQALIGTDWYAPSKQQSPPRTKNQSSQEAFSNKQRFDQTNFDNRMRKTANQFQVKAKSKFVSSTDLNFSSKDHSKTFIQANKI